MRHILLGTMLAMALAALAFSPASAKTVKECNAEYAANTAAIKGTQKKAVFMTACRAGTEVVPGSAKAPPDTGLRKPTAAELDMERRVKRDMNICIGC